METSDVIELLQRNILCLRSLAKLDDELLVALKQNEPNSLSELQKRRTGLFNTIHQIEQTIANHFDYWRINASQQQYEQYKLLLKTKAATLRSVIDLDAQVIEQINKLRTETVQKLQAIQAGRKTVGAYRSKIESVELAEQNKTLDREA